MTQPEADEERYLRVSEVAQMIHASVHTVQRLIATGELASINVGAGEKPYYRVPISEVRAWLQRRRTTPRQRS